LDIYYHTITHIDINLVFMVPESVLTGLTGCPRDLLDRILLAKKAQVKAQERGEAVYFLGRELNALSIEVARTYTPQSPGGSGPARPGPGAGSSGGADGDGSEDSSGDGPRSGGIGNGDSRSKREAEKIKRDGWRR
jgi:hypothetical protein